MTTETQKPLVGVGDPAPEFRLRDTDGQAVAVSELKGERNVLLAFYPSAFSTTCTKEFCMLRDDNADLVDVPDLEVFGVSTDPVWALRTWKEQEKYPNRFLSDFWPHGEACRAYGTLIEKAGVAVRATFLIDKQGIIRFAERQPIEQIGTPRDQDAWRKAIAELS